MQRHAFLFPGIAEAPRRSRRVAAHVSAVSRRHELLILCARIGFNP
jgi:hypothetical protein